MLDLLDDGRQFAAQSLVKPDAEDLTDAMGVQMDVCCQGGYSLGRRLFAEIARQGLRFAFHSWGTAPRSRGRRPPRRLLAADGGGVARVPLLLHTRQLRHVPISAGGRKS